MTADTAGLLCGPVGIPSMDIQPTHITETAIEVIRHDAPDAWGMFRRRPPAPLALWAYLCLVTPTPGPFRCHGPG